VVKKKAREVRNRERLGQSANAADRGGVSRGARAFTFRREDPRVKDEKKSQKQALKGHGQGSVEVSKGEGQKGKDSSQ